MTQTNKQAHLVDIQLVTAYQQQQRKEAFGELYRRYFDKVFAYCLKITNNRVDAYDIASNVFLIVAEKLPSLRNPVTFPCWLFRIAHNECLNSFRLNQKKRCLPIEYAYHLGVEPEVLGEAENGIEKAELILSKLSEENKALLVAKYFQQNSIAEMRQAYGLSESAMKMRLLRARQQAQTLVMSM